jgi:hypothetical protein
VVTKMEKFKKTIIWILKYILLPALCSAIVTLFLMYLEYKKAMGR